MKLLEYEAKRILSSYGIPVPRGDIVTDGAQALAVALKFNPPLAIKAQVPVAGRGRAGGVLFTDSVDEAEGLVRKLLSMSIKGIPVKSVLIEEKVQAMRELYLGITVDRFYKGYVAVASSEGGMEIEEVAAKFPEKVIKFPIDLRRGFRLYHARQIAKRMGYSGGQLLELGNIFYNLYRAGMGYDAELIEINPLIEKPDKSFVAVDARMIIDDNALFRHPEFRALSLRELSSPQEIEAAKSGLAYVKLDGNIGVIGNGAGLVMATLDTIQLYGGKPANFLDVGGGISSEGMRTALKIVLSDPDVKVLLINIFGGITRCDEVARGILEAKEKLGIEKPLIIRLVGTNEEDARRILAEAGLFVLSDVEEAVKYAVKIAESGGVNIFGNNRE
ncbi:MAG: ADP-forming succinate--CoA ligase subunit beta [Candidatus Bathyarchaeia archaeon]